MKEDKEQQLSTTATTTTTTTAIELLPIEQVLANGGGGNNAMATLTWFRGDYRTTIPILQERMFYILKCNPWLGGRVVVVKKDTTNKRQRRHVLQYNNHNMNTTTTSSLMEAVTQHYFHVDTETILPRNTPITKFGSTLSHLLLKDGPTEPLWKVTIVPAHNDNDAMNNNTCFALIVGMSHIIADGFAFYTIQNMLTNFANDDCTIVKPLIVERLLSSEHQQIQMMGGRDAEYSILQSSSFLLNCIGGVLQAATIGPKPQSRVYLVDSEEMETYKQRCIMNNNNNDETASSSSSSFVSTNDVLTSWFLQGSTCTNGFMAVNFRERLDGHTTQHAGNYENVVYYRRSDSVTPNLIRSSLTSASTASTTGNEQQPSEQQQQQQLRRTVTWDRPISFTEIAFGSTALASNWSSFAQPPNIPNCIEELHIPLYDMTSLLPSTMAVMLLFRVGTGGSYDDDQQNKQKLGVMVSGTPDKLQGLVTKNAPFLKEWNF